MLDRLWIFTVNAGTNDRPTTAFTDDVPTKAHAKLPAWFDAERQRITFRDVIEEWERKAGYKPDILHLWSWAYQEKTIQRWGEYGGQDYDRFGGQPAFKEAIADVQDNLHIPMSLYLNATLCCIDTPTGKLLADKAVQLEESRGHAFMVRAYELKKRFKDSFASDAPEMLVPTERGSVYANRFPGKARTVWMVFS